MTLTHLDLDRIEGLAKAATPGEWAQSAPAPRMIYGGPDGARWVAGAIGHDDETAADAAYIVAVQPTTVLALITRIRELEGSYDELQALTAKWKGEALGAYDLAVEWSKPDVMQLHGGEMTAQEIRTVRAMMLGLAAEFKQRFATALQRKTS